MHALIPEHEIVPQDQVPEVLSKHGLKLEKFPRILAEDPAIEGLDAVKGDLIKINRKSATAGRVTYFRVVV